MRRYAIALCLAGLAGASVIAMYQPDQYVEIADGVVVRQMTASEWNLSCVGPCVDQVGHLLCKDFVVVGEPEVDFGSRYNFVVVCPNGTSGDSQKDL